VQKNGNEQRTKSEKSIYNPEVAVQTDQSDYRKQAKLKTLTNQIAGKDWQRPKGKKVKKNQKITKRRISRLQENREWKRNH
jgi:hypothetical protein